MNSRTERSMCGVVICEIFRVDDENATADKKKHMFYTIYGNDSKQKTNMNQILKIKIVHFLKIESPSLKNKTKEVDECL